MSGCNRRQFLKFGAAGLATALVPAPVWSAAARVDRLPRDLKFYNLHTGEHLKVCYYDSGDYCDDALQQVNYILRDFRTGDIKPIDPGLLDILFSVARRLDTRSPFHIISGYRSPKTNAMLRRTTSGVAKYSYHLLGRAIDIRLPGRRTRTLRNACIGLKAGGVGFYPKSNFVHVDTGAVRTW